MKKKLNCIMLIDDDYATNLYHQIIIEEGDWTNELVVQTGGEAALDYLKQPFDAAHPQPDLLFLDLNMPRMTGWEFLDVYQHLPMEQRAKHVVILSTSSNPDDLSRAAKNLFVQNYKSKPLTEEILAELIEE